MVVIRFSVMYDKIRRGEKKQTIRPVKSYKHIKRGDKIHCYSTLKWPGIRRPLLSDLLYTGICSKIEILPWGEIKNMEKLSKSDGFNNLKEMRTWFKKHYKDLSDNKKFRVIYWN